MLRDILQLSSFTAASKIGGIYWASISPLLKRQCHIVHHVFYASIMSHMRCYYIQSKCPCWHGLNSAYCTVCRAPRSWWTMKMKIQWNIVANYKGDFRNSMGRCSMTEGLRNMSVLDMIMSRQKSGTLQDIGRKRLVETYNECSSINGAEHTSARVVAGLCELLGSARLFWTESHHGGSRLNYKTSGPGWLDLW